MQNETQNEKKLPREPEPGRVRFVAEVASNHARDLERALAFVDTDAGLEDGDAVGVDLRGTPVPGTLVRPPFVAPTPPSS